MAAAFNAAVRKAEETTSEKMGKLTAGMPGLPPGMKLPVLRPSTWPIQLARRADRGAAPPAGRGRQVGVAHGLPPAAARPRGRAAAGARAAAGRHADRAIASRCHTFTEDAVCATACDPRRDATKLCVVETPADQAALERTGAFSGLYFVLMGKLSPLDGIGPKDIGLAKLFERAHDGAVQEVILATNFTAEGEATAHVIGEALKAARPQGDAAGARRAGRQRTRIRRSRHHRARAGRPDDTRRG